MDIENIEQLNDVELFPGWKVTLVFEPGELSANVADCGTVDQITLSGHGMPKNGVDITSETPHQKHLFRPLAAAITKQYAEEIAAHERECYVRDTQPDPYYGRLLPSEMR